MSNTVKCTVCGSMTLPCKCAAIPKWQEGIYFVPDQFGPHDLLKLVNCLESISNKMLTQAVAEILLRINKPPMIVKPYEYSDDK